MSNKTDLQTLNTDYAALIDTLRGKAVGGGGSVETCTVEIIDESSLLSGISYIDPSMKLVENYEFTGSHILEVAKKTLYGLRSCRELILLQMRWIFHML